MTSILETQDATCRKDNNYSAGEVTKAPTVLDRSPIPLGKAYLDIKLRNLAASALISKQDPVSEACSQLQVQDEGVRKTGRLRIAACIEEACPALSPVLIEQAGLPYGNRSAISFTGKGQMDCPSSETLVRFEQWLEEHGAQLNGLHVQPCAEGLEWGCGVYVDQQGKSAEAGMLCYIPLDTGLPLTVDRCVADPLVGALLMELLEDGEIDGRLCFMLYLVIHRALRERSPWAPYLAVLPRACSVPLCWGFRELQQLHGTPLLQATLSKRRQLQAMWGSTVEAILKAAFELIGLSEDPSPQDFVWSYTMVWSRLLEWPAEEGGEEGHMEEGLLPFIDCCNHVFESPVTRVAGDGGMLLTTVAPLPPATQVCFSYGDKGNEGLLFLYGFALPTNPHDRLLLHVPPSALHDLDALEARLALLQSRGLSLRWLLPDPQRVDAAAAAWQEAVAAAHVLTMPAEEATQAALDEASPESTSNNEDDELIPTACAKGSSTEEALQWLRKLLEARQRELETDLDEISLDELRESSASWEEFRGTEAETSCRSDRNVEEGPIKMGGEAGEGDFKGQARYCEYYRASERRLCSAYLERSSTTSLHTLDSSQ